VRAQLEMISGVPVTPFAADGGIDEAARAARAAVAGVIRDATLRPPLAPLSPADRAGLAHVMRALAPVS
jgi:dihydrodipicolinate synthase/N-acetylneuraminate lyase